ncbi:MAG: hypothetical protein DSZ28_09150 [Thiothrix sp.]|nr:MAG: hypothetical protein DSZ28_09150 [Thiothrix sp.]
MFDARKLPASDDSLSCDVCIIGAGPVGLSVAREFIDSDLKVVFLESGGITLGGHADDLSEPASDAVYGTTSFITNVRHYGGNSNAWNIIRNDGVMGVRFATFQEVDFQSRPGIEDSGWPIGPEDLAPYIRRAAENWNLAPDGFSPSAQYRTEVLDMIEVGGKLETSMFQFPDAAHARENFRKLINAAPNIVTYYHATACRLVPDASGKRVESVIIKPSADKEILIAARQFIVSSSSMGSCQLLLSSPTGRGYVFGNSGDSLGRYMIDHPLINGGQIILKDRAFLDDMLLFDIDERLGAFSMGYLHLSTALARGEKLPNLNMMLFPRHEGQSKVSAELSMHKRAHGAAVRCRNALLRKQIPAVKDVFHAIVGSPLILGDIVRLYTDPHVNLGRGGWTKKGPPSKRYDRLEVLHLAEQLPHRENRMYLSAETNRLGKRKITFDYRLHDADIKAFKRAQHVMAQAVKESGLGEFEITFADTDEIDLVTMSCGHHMGTMRMGTDPASSVVDANCKVHETDNLYVASTGTIPAGGSANPTFTAITLGLRIADRLKNTLKGE